VAIQVGVECGDMELGAHDVHPLLAGGVVEDPARDASAMLV
jgi:hypothetical protein